MAGELVLGEQGQSNYQLVLPDAFPSPSVGESLQQTARLAQAAFQANGMVVPIVAEANHDPAKPSIYLGNTAFARRQAIDLSKLSGWAYVVKAIGPDLVIAGRDDPAPAESIRRGRPTWDRIGTAKGVVDFLREYAGTRFLYPDLPPRVSIAGATKIDFLKAPAFEFLPVPKIAVPDDLNVEKTPLLEFQTMYPPRGSFFDIANNNFPLVDSIFGGHTYERAIPRETYAETHPEYFALIGGERTAKAAGNAQYCISNPAVQELFFQDLVDTIDRGFQGVDLGQPDGFRPCQCAECAKLYDTGNDWGEKLWILHRNLAERVEKARPGNQVTMMSYIQTALPPKTFKTFPKNTRILLTGTNEEDIAPWRDYEVPAGFSSYLYNWCPNLVSRYTPMRTPLYVESQTQRLTRNHFRSIYRDGAGNLFGLEGPVYYTMGRMFDDPENLQAKVLLHEFCGAAFGKAASPMLEFYGQLYHGIELYSEYLATRSPAWTYHNIYGQRRKHLSDPFQLLGFLYPPGLLASLEKQLGQAEQIADTEKVRQRLAVVRREFDYLQALARVVHLHHAYQIQPDRVSRDRLLDAIDDRNALVEALFSGPRGGAKVSDGWTFPLFPPLGHNADHLRLAHDGYQEPYANTALNWDTQAMRAAPLPGANRMTASLVADAASQAAALWEPIAATPVGQRLREWRSRPIDETDASAAAVPATVRMAADATRLAIRVEIAGTEKASPDDRIDLYLAPPGGKEITYQFTLRRQEDSRQEAARGFNSDPLDPRFGRFDPDWNGDWTAASQQSDNKQSWTADLSIPWKTLGVEQPTDGAFWRGNVVVTRGDAAGKPERWLWSASGSTRIVDDVNDFGEIVFTASAGKGASSRKPAAPSKLPLTELRESLYASSFELPKAWKALKDAQPLPAADWLFRADPLEIGLREGWEKADAGTAEWLKMPVPSFWAETEAVGKYVGYGWQRTAFTAPPAWKGRRVRLLFGAADEQAWVYLNGRLVGQHTRESEQKTINELWEEPFTVELTESQLDFSQPNVLTVRVHNSLANGGLWRPVLLQATAAEASR
ncbi:DUF4838 domain-containing protein [Lignipirellula cremea]|uniref:DUF4838 domain-containing protein n=1 Tax=Lignipirellula cremea TaxID=2528010 RepID=UPI0018D21761|nr:DUF4838 domain-containing protein [Lignipirellula cremea]